MFHGLPLLPVLLGAVAGVAVFVAVWAVVAIVWKA